MGSNLRYEDLKDIIKQIGPGSEQTEQGLSQKEVQDEWKRLASTMSGLK